jgi:uncharacterized protein with PIN domain
LKFVADSMLGKLTRWLRMLGHNVLYAADLNDKTLIKIAATQKRILLTRDVELHQHATGQHVEVFLVQGESEIERLAALSKRFNLKLELDPNVSRCPKCNSKIKRSKKNEIADRIPAATRRFYEEFWECPKCRKIYWQGAHWKGIGETLEKTRKILAE